MEEVLKKSFLNAISTSDISTGTIIIMLIITTLLGFYIFYVYRMFCKYEFYSKNFATSLVAIAIITSIIILTVKSSIVISLGMVGALSIVRFRTPIKEPLDLTFLFWAISIGIICGANLYEIAIEGSLMVTIVLFILKCIPNIRNTLLLVINTDSDIQEDEIIEVLKNNTISYSVRSRNCTKNSTDMIVEVKTKSEKDLLQSIISLEKVQNASLMTHDGELAGL